MATLLVVDDEPNVLYSFQTSLQSDDLKVLTASTARQGIELVESDRPDAVILDVRLPDMSGIEAFHHLHSLHPRLPIIVITAFSTTEIAIEAMRDGAFEYLLKPVDLRQLRSVVQKALEVSRLNRVPAVFDADEREDAPVDRIVGQSAAMQEVYKTIGRVAPQDVTVLIQGESGTGKELIARAIYYYSRRSHMPFLAINCAAIPESLLESELFGHERGAFTGAERRRIGKLEQANGGTVLLDEIADMSPATQAKVLRVLQEQQFERLGSNETIHTDVRLIAATNQNLDALVAQGRFRRDLFYRLNVLTIQLPPLRDRLDDLPLLVNHFIKVFQRQLGCRVRHVTPEAHAMLAAHPWPGNVRELQSAIKYAIVHARSEVLTVDSLPASIRCRDTASPPSADSDRGPTLDENVALAEFIRTLLNEGKEDIYRRVHWEVDRVLFEQVLGSVRGNQQVAAELLGISRTTLRVKLKSLGMQVGKRLLSDSGHDDQILLDEDR